MWAWSRWLQGSRNQQQGPDLPEISTAAATGPAAHTFSWPDWQCGRLSCIRIAVIRCLWMAFVIKYIFERIFGNAESASDSVHRSAIVSSWSGPFWPLLALALFALALSGPIQRRALRVIGVYTVLGCTQMLWTWPAVRLATSVVVCPDW